MQHVNMYTCILFICKYVTIHLIYKRCNTYICKHKMLNTSMFLKYLLRRLREQLIECRTYTHE